MPIRVEYLDKTKIELTFFKVTYISEIVRDTAQMI